MKFLSLLRQQTGKACCSQPTRVWRNATRTHFLDTCIILFCLSLIHARKQAKKLLITARRIRNLSTPASAEMRKKGGFWQASFIFSPLPLPFFPTSAGYMSRINLAESSCHMAVTATLAFPSILAILQSAGAQLSYTPPWLSFEVLSLEEDFNPKIWSTFFFYEENVPFGCVMHFAFRFFIQLSSRTAHMSCDFPLLITGSYINIRWFCNT